MKIEVLTINGWQEVYFNSDSAENEYAPTVGIAGADLEFWMSGSQGVLPGEAITENNQIIIRFDPVYALGLRANFKTQITNQGAINAYRLYEMSIKGYSNILPVKASFYYQAKSIAPGSDANDPTNNPKNLIDGNYGTQLQTVYETEPLRGMNYITIDMGLDDEGNLQKVDAIDMVSGFLELNNTRYNIKNRYTLQYSTDGVNFYPISKNAQDFWLEGGESISVEKSDLGENFRIRYIRIVLEQAEKVEISGNYVVALTELSVYQNVVLEEESKLIPTTKLTQATLDDDATIYAEDTTSFPDSGTAFISAEEFTYTGKTTASFTGCTGVKASLIDARISEYLENDNDIYDPDYLLQKLGDKLYKDTTISTYLNTTAKLKNRVKTTNIELYKNHTKVNVPAVARPDALIGDTVKITDIENNIIRNYFIESFSKSLAGPVLLLAYYP